MSRFLVALILEGDSPDGADDSYEYDMIKDVEVAAEGAGFKVIRMTTTSS